MVWNISGLERPVVFSGFSSVLETRLPGCPKGRKFLGSRVRIVLVIFCLSFKSKSVPQVVVF